MDDDSQLNHNLCSIVIASIDFSSFAIFGNLRNETRQGDNPIFKLLYGIHSFLYCYGLQHDGHVFIFHEIRIKHSVIVIVKNGKCFFSIIELSDSSIEVEPFISRIWFINEVTLSRIPGTNFLNQR